ncbi:Agamous-like MADS-box protein AGL97 [Morus notabilis]|uniref:Agamous-like MADS-box protein AGL97 n=1 Tax=Morus notabilis TaxID=981085 RepID=W9QXH4_9ROSA|nr:Agamous-like MADS-box protein AGL97 [Morus notabilis]
MARKRGFNEAMEEGGRKAKNYVTFSKRRKGLLNKAFDLCYYYDAQIALVVLSPTGNPFAFGHSSVDDVLHCYLGGQTTPMDGRFEAEERRRQTERLERLKRRMKELGQSREMKKVKAWIEREWGSCGTTLEELEVLKGKYLALLDNVRNRLSFSGKEEKIDVCPLAAVVGSSNEMSFSVEKLGTGCGNFGFTSIRKSFGKEEKFDLTGFCPLSVVNSPNDMSVEELGGNCAYFGTDSADTSIRRRFGIGSFTSFSGNEERVDLIDVYPLSVVNSSNDMPYSVEKLGHTSMVKRLGIGSSSSFFGATTGGVGPFNDYVNFDCVGMENYTTLFPHIGGACVSPLSSMDDISYSVETFGTSCANSCTDYVDSSMKRGLGISSSSSFFGDGVGTFNDHVDFDYAGMEGYTTLFPQIGGCVRPLAAMDSPNDMSYAVEKFGATCSPSGTDSVGDGDGSVSNFGGGGGDTQNDLSLMEYSDTNCNYNVVEISEDEVFHYLGHVNFELLSE